MAEIYANHMRSLDLDVERPLPLARVPADLSAHAPGGIVQAVDAINARFTRLPNPDLVMYVAPHLSADGRYPIPAYTTVFPMYESVEYALPGEIERIDPAGGGAAAKASAGATRGQRE